MKKSSPCLGAVLWICALLLSLPSSHARGIVSAIHNSSQILAKVSFDKEFKTSDRVMIISSRENKTVAFGMIHDFHTNAAGELITKIDITEILENNLIVPGDDVEHLDFRSFVSRRVPGFNSVTLRGSHEIPAQYKELAYMGVFSADGHTLDHDEMLVSPFQIQYGVTDDFGVKIVNALFLDGYANLGLKYKVAQNKHMKLTTNVFGAYKTDKQDWIGQFGGILTLPTNAKFQTHWVANFTFDRQFEQANNTEALGLFQDSDLRSITEYVTDSWNRILFGPSYNVKLQTFGGTLSYMWIWDTFHLSAGAGTRNFSDLHFDTESYYYVYDFFWRF